jgi:hypothetical protein
MTTVVDLFSVKTNRVFLVAVVRNSGSGFLIISLLGDKLRSREINLMCKLLKNLIFHVK